MAPSIILKRSSHLNPCDTSGRNLRSRKIITVNKSSQKVNISAKNKKSRVTAKVVSTKKRISIKPHEDTSSDSSKIKQIAKSIREKKKTSGTVVNNNINKNKSRKASKKEETNSSSTGLRQLSLQESFKRQSLPRLRPRQNKNYDEDCKLQQKYLKPQEQNSLVLLEKLDIRKLKKTPIYKTIKTSSELSSENKNNIYDFKYDANDTKEKLIKKKKKKTKSSVNKVKKKLTKKSVHKKITVKAKTLDNEPSNSPPDTHPIVEIAQNNPPLNSVRETAPLLSELTRNVELLETNTEAQTIKETASPNHIQQVAEQIGKQHAKKPKIIAIEDANNITIIKSPSNTPKDNQPFRSKDIYNSKPKMMQYKKALNCSLLTKSLSPIMREHDIFDPGSPWRLQMLPMFSHLTRNFVQSTPYENKADKRCIMHMKDGSLNNDKTANASEVILKNINSSVQNMLDKTTPKKDSSSCRKFGTEITNIELFNNNSMLQNSNVEVVNDQPVTETEIKLLTNVQSDKIVLQSPNHSCQLSFDDADDKENVAANHQTPKKSTKKKVKKWLPPNFSPLKEYDRENKVQKENMDPQPGPSGLKNLKNYNKEERILRQSNLNNFLNVMDMPENVKISTKHGLFDNTHSMTVSGSAIKKVEKPMAELENAFGFCEDESEFNKSPVKSEIAIDKASTKVQASGKPVTQLNIIQHNRLSLGELRNHLLPKKPNNNMNNKQAVDLKVVKISEPVGMKQQKQLIDVANFSDTFDVLSECEKQSNYGGDIPLFIDLEPTHFLTPPQHSYKRKRTKTYNFSEDSDEENKENVITQMKKKKSTKAERKCKKRLEEWIQSINSTFQEIDEHDLIVE